MASSLFTESEAPRDFRVSSAESDGHYTKCLLCYTVKRNFYCAECIRTGNFVHSSMPYADRYSEKQAKLLRLKANRKHILDRCEKLLLPKLKKDTLLTEAKQSRDKLDLLRLAIEQRRSKIEEKRKVLNDLKAYNNELQQKLPRYQKRVAMLGKHAQSQSIELQNKVSVYSEQAEKLAALRRSRIRQLTKYIFPVYMTYDTSDSIEDMEFIGSSPVAECERARLHVVSAALPAHGEPAQTQAWMAANSESGAGPGGEGARDAAAALALAAQLLALLAWTLDRRLPHCLPLSEYVWSVSGGAWRRVCACAAALAGAHVHTHDPALDPAHVPASRTHPLAALHALVVAATTDDPALGRVGWECWRSRPEAGEWCARWAAPDDADDAEPEHLSWPDTAEMEELSAPPPAPPASLVTSAAASIASMWRGWTK